MSKHRKPADIIGAMLSAVRVYGKKTRIMYGANLSYSLLSKYLDETLSLGLIKFNEDISGFELTDRGMEYLKHYNEYSTLRERLDIQLEQTKVKLDKMLNKKNKANEYEA